MNKLCLTWPDLGIKIDRISDYDQSDGAASTHNEQTRRSEAEHPEVEHQGRNSLCGYRAETMGYAKDVELPCFI